jgi:tetratricopeptide (TPR) repeat protein
MWMLRFGLGALIVVLLFGLTLLIPAVRDQLEWRLDAAAGVVRGWRYPAETLPTLVSSAATPRQSPTRSPSPTATEPAEPVPTPTPLPESVSLFSPRWEKQDWNNCGPAALALGLRFYGWSGDQFDISDLLKPDRGDKNVNVEELAYYVRTQAGWLGAQYRIGGDIEMLKRFIANGYAVIVETSFELPQDEGGGGWTGHYLLLTGYDEVEGVFTTQDTYWGADRRVTYQVLLNDWRAFNHLYMVIYPVDQAGEVEALLGPDLDLDQNRQRAIDRSLDEIAAGTADGFTWANLGTNLVYFERYEEAAEAFDTALSLGLPWRFTRHVFGPYIAYYNVGRFDDVIILTEATLNRTPKAEEARLWHGWASFQLGDVQTAIYDFRAALQVNPNYLDAKYALDFLGLSP